MRELLAVALFLMPLVRLVVLLVLLLAVLLLVLVLVLVLVAVRRTRGRRVTVR